MAFNTNLLSQPTLVFLFINVFAALLLHVSRLPLWLIVFSLTALVWRMSMFSGRVPKPNWFVKLLLVCSGFYGVYASYGTALTIESMVSLLIAGVMLKPLEVEKQQHSYLLIFLNYFLCALLFLFDRTPLDFLLVLLVMIFTLGSQVLVHFYDQPNRLTSLKLGFGLLLKSLPLALLLFLILPRLGPLWTLSIPTQSGVVGLSDSMSPGSIAELGENDELAFRVKLLDEPLPMNQRYWRAFTLSDFDGKTWQQGSLYSINNDFEFFDEAQDSVRYEVMIEPHEKNWLFAIGASKPLSSGIVVQNDATLESKRRLYNQWQYQVESNVSELLPQTSLSRTERRRYTNLPEDSNLQSQAFAQNLQQQTADLPQFISALRAYISDKNFSYTLSPGTFEGDDQIDEFLFQSKSGFCSYYAGSVAFLLRSIDVPARVVLGYMGGEENTLTNALSVYQYDAHAWVEVFFEGQGWLRIDPTAWVAPERVESGLQRAIPNEFKGFNSQSEWLKQLRKRWQAFDYFWNDWMLSYKGNKQQAILQDLWGERSASELIGLLVCVFVLLGFGLFSFLWWDQISKPVSYEQKVFNALYTWFLSVERQPSSEKHTAKTSQERGLTMQALCHQLASRYPHLSNGFTALNKQMSAALYQPNAQGLDKQKARQILTSIKTLKKQA
jgi:transglutaminase-like putative cysteine protease